VEGVNEIEDKEKEEMDMEREQEDADSSGREFDGSANKVDGKGFEGYEYANCSPARFQAMHK
jgi:hypothetical protein